MVEIHRNTDIKEHYKIEEELGSGTYAIVRKAVNLNSGEVYAVKIIEKQDLDMDEEN
jgi:serine/threonine protein kinase